MRYTILLVLFLFSTYQAMSQGLSWTTLTSGWSFEQIVNNAPKGKASVRDASGNIYVTANNGFLAKYDASGNLLWTVDIGGDGYSVATDGSGSVYVTGEYSASIDADPGAGVFTLTSAGGKDIFIEKLDPGGNFVWAKSIGGTNRDLGIDIVVDDSSNIYIAGGFWAEGTTSVDFDPNAGIATADSIGDFVLKLDSAGNYKWVYTEIPPIFTGVSTNTYFKAIDLDDDGNVYVVGQYISATSNVRSYLRKLNSLGQPGWILQHLPGTQAEDMLDVKVKGQHVYTTGVYDSIPLAHRDFVLKLDTASNVSWLKSFGGGSGSWSGSLDVDVDGNVYVTGGCNQYGGDFDPGPGVTTFNSYGLPYMFILKLDPAGSYEWASGHMISMQAGPTPRTAGLNIAVDDQCNLYVTGAISSGQTNIDVDPGAGIYNLSGEGIFLQKITCTATAINMVEKSSLRTDIYPNPSSGVINISSSSIIRSVQITDVLGRVVYGASPDSKTDKVDVNSASGLYYITLTTDDGIITQKIVIER